MGFLTGILASIIEWIISFEQPKIIAWLTGLYSSWQQSQADAAAQAAALKKQADDIKDPKTSDEQLAKDGENILNGTNPNP